MNKYIKQLVESFFDDIEDDVLDTDNEMHNININSAVRLKFYDIIKNSPYKMIVDINNIELTHDIVSLYEKYSNIAIFIINYELSSNLSIYYNIKPDNIYYQISIINDYEVEIEICTKGISTITINKETGQYNYMPSSYIMGFNRFNNIYDIKQIHLFAAIYKKFGYKCDTYIIPYCISKKSDILFEDMFDANESEAIYTYITNCPLPLFVDNKLNAVNIKKYIIADYDYHISEKLLIAFCNVLHDICKSVVYVLPDHRYGKLSDIFKKYIEWSTKQKNIFLTFTKLHEDNNIKYILLLLKDKIINFPNGNYMYNIEQRKDESGTDTKYGKYTIWDILFEYPVDNKYVYITSKAKLYASGKLEYLTYNER